MEQPGAPSKPEGRELGRASWGTGTCRGSQQRKGGKEERGQNTSSGAGSKMATGKAGDRWSLSAAEREKWGKGKEKINITTVRNLKINPNP